MLIASYVVATPLYPDTKEVASVDEASLEDLLENRAVPLSNSQPNFSHPITRRDWTGWDLRYEPFTNLGNVEFGRLTKRTKLSLAVSVHEWIRNLDLTQGPQKTREYAQRSGYEDAEPNIFVDIVYDYPTAMGGPAFPPTNRQMRRTGEPVELWLSRRIYQDGKVSAVLGPPELYFDISQLGVECVHYRITYSIWKEQPAGWMIPVYNPPPRGRSFWRAYQEMMAIEPDMLLLIGSLVANHVSSLLRAQSTRFRQTQIYPKRTGDEIFDRVPPNFSIIIILYPWVSIRDPPPRQFSSGSGTSQTTYLPPHALGKLGELPRTPAEALFNSFQYAARTGDLSRADPTYGQLRSRDRVYTLQYNFHFDGLPCDGQDTNPLGWFGGRNRCR
ncbi:MAG: hypothetical protein M1837_002419 [Sclerophora amabilis]|nr:MAG: hypothetical protein M1837_002419 [Sclerophora amabilis]